MKTREINRFTITQPEGEVITPDSNQVRSAYVEEHWLAYIGTTALLLARRIDLALSTGGTGKSVIDVHKMADALGCYPEEVIAACHRLCRYGLASWSDRDPTLYLNRHWPKIPAAIQTPEHRAALMALPDSGREKLALPEVSVVK